MQAKINKPKIKTIGTKLLMEKRGLLKVCLNIILDTIDEIIKIEIE